MAEQTPLTIETLRAFLRDNLRVEVSVKERPYSGFTTAYEVATTVRIMLGDEQISESESGFTVTPDT